MPHKDTTDPDVGLWNGGVAYRENIPGRSGAFTDETAALTTQVMTCIGVPCYPGDIITNISVQVGATAAGTPTNQWAALYSSAATPVLLGQSADGTSAAIGAHNTLTFTLTKPVLLTTEGIFYAAIMVKATTVPSLICQNHAVAMTALGTGQAVRVQTSGSSLTATAPSTIASPTVTFKVPYVGLS